MTASELRIGNWINIIGLVPTQVVPKHIEFIAEGDDQYDPIPLTEEWLLKFGFIRGGYEGLTVAKGDFELHGDCPADYPTGREYPPIGIRVNDRLDVYVEYVHQLQNLYYALTGEELTITECQHAAHSSK